MKDASVSSQRAPPGKNFRNAKAGVWALCLYVAGETPRAKIAFNNLKDICEKQLKGRYKINVIDVLKNPEIARKNQIFALPTVVRKIPAPHAKLIGDLSNTERVLKALGLLSERNN